MLTLPKIIIHLLQISKNFLPLHPWSELISTSKISRKRILILTILPALLPDKSKPHDDQLILLHQLGFMCGWVSCHLRWPTNSKTTARCKQCQKLLTQPPPRTFMYHRDRFPAHITPDVENQPLDAFKPSQMDDLSHYCRVTEVEESYSEGGLSHLQRKETTNSLLSLHFLKSLIFQ